MKKEKVIVSNRTEDSPIAWVIRMIVVTVVAVATLFVTVAPSVAIADISTGNTTIHGYKPEEVVSTDIDVSDNGLDNLGPFLADKVKGVVIFGLPILAVASVVVLIYNAVRNMFLPDEDPREARKAGHKPKRPMGQVLKDIFMMFFWILFAWIIVELIIYAVTHFETMAQQSLTGGGTSHQTTTQQVSSQSQSSQPDKQATPVGGGTATPVGGSSATPVGSGTGE